ncbi:MULTISPECIES: hypothetical protein [unclassified Pannonibacter]|uniref:hypothetical protein n=1 Tax=unclassified Pannonibacter TaxID=2627228 RepID=UPI001648BF17|nr:MULTISPECIES: hypothetical protein [unclassified Pannonibacter]
MTPELEAKKNHLVNRSVEIEGFFRELAGTVENHQISRGLKGLSDTMAGIGGSILVQKPTYKETIAALASHSDSIQLLAVN